MRRAPPDGRQLADGITRAVVRRAPPDGRQLDDGITRAEAMGVGSAGSLTSTVLRREDNEEN